MSAEVGRHQGPLLLRTNDQIGGIGYGNEFHVTSAIKDEAIIQTTKVANGLRTRALARLSRKLLGRQCLSECTLENQVYRNCERYRSGHDSCDNMSDRRPRGDQPGTG